ncbi:uncharacterized protein BP5553_08568 [Venustampulla echinocandica]|uniref:Uncharacterized protein n=1 Tax=Venustampulla echinocandica TaxID=2656787 RepID=A0A370TEM4_9HELO|nr:uncharacterized protein BP5553_08568 [Venustampulla echinocandica]RDL33129.1 hypothetical protein BP5553_08568 [Venustampulla echinocandica]
MRTDILKKLPFFFGGKPVDQVYFPWLLCRNKTNAPVCAFIDAGWVRHNDQKDYFAARARQEQQREAIAPRPPRLSLQERWQRGLPLADEPKEEPFIDPYYVAIMIAMAQASPRPPPPTGFGPPTLQEDRSLKKVFLVTMMENEYAATLYSAEVTHEFLRKLDYPYERSDAQLSIRKQYVVVDPPKWIIDMALTVFESIDRFYWSIDEEAKLAREMYSRQQNVPTSSHATVETAHSATPPSLKRKPSSSGTDSPSDCGPPKPKRPQLDLYGGISADNVHYSETPGQFTKNPEYLNQGRTR